MEAQAPSREPVPPADPASHAGQRWSPKTVTAAATARLPAVTFTKSTLARLFGWQHGATRDICPTVIFRYAPGPGMPQAELAPVRLLPPSRDEAYVASKRQEGGGRTRVDGYIVPVDAVKQLYSRLPVPPGRRLVFESGGWRGTALLLDVSHKPADVAAAAAGPAGSQGAASEPLSSGQPTRAADEAARAPQSSAPRAQQGEAPPVGQAGSSATPRSMPPATCRTDSAPQPRSAPAGSAGGAPLGSVPPAAGRINSAPQPREVRAASAGGAPLSSPTPPGHAAGARAAAASSGKLQPLHARLNECSEVARRIITSGREGWLPTSEVHSLMEELRSWDFGSEAEWPDSPAVGDLYATRFRKHVKGGEPGLHWVKRRSSNLKVRGKEVLQVVYYTTADGTLQRRAYHFLDQRAPGGLLHLLHYHKPEHQLSGKDKRGPRKRSREEGGEAGEEDDDEEEVVVVDDGGYSSGGSGAQRQRRVTGGFSHSHTPRESWGGSPEQQQQQQQPQRGQQAEVAERERRAARRPADEEQAPADEQQRGQDAEAAAAAARRTEEERSHAAAAGRQQQQAAEAARSAEERRRQEVETARRYEEQRAEEQRWQEEARAAAAEERRLKEEEEAAAAARVAAAEAERARQHEAAAAAAAKLPPPQQPQHEPRTKAEPESPAAVGGVDGTDRVAVFRALMPILRQAGVPSGDLVAFLQRCIKNNADDEDVVMHWTFLAEAHQAGDTATIRTWVDEALKGLG